MSKYRNEIQRIDQTETTNYCSGDTFIFILENVTCSMIFIVHNLLTARISLVYLIDDSYGFSGLLRQC